MLIYAGRPVSKRVQAFRGATGGKANVDFDRLYFDCRNRRRDCDRNRSNLGSNFPRGQFARFLDVILRGARVWMASCGALDRAEARQARKTRKLILLTGQCPLYPQERTCAAQQRMSALGQKRTYDKLFDHLVGNRHHA